MIPPGKTNALRGVRCLTDRRRGLDNPQSKAGGDIGRLRSQSPPEEETTLANLSGIMKELSKERDRLHQQLSGLNAALEAFAEVYRGNNGIKPRRKISAKGRARIAAAQRARWAKVKGQQKVVPKPRKRPERRPAIRFPVD